MNKTQIEWCRNPDGTPGYTWNPITGCLNHVNGMCKGGNFPCYAYRLAHGRLSTLYIRNKWQLAPMQDNPISNMNLPSEYMDPFYPRFWPERLYFGIGTGKPKGIFVCDMSDLFGIGIPEEWTGKVLQEIYCCPDDRFYLLTKQPQNLAKFSPFPDNCWVEVTATNWQMAHKAMYWLGQIKATVKYISAEPLLDSFTDPDPTDSLKMITAHEVVGDLDWLIIGAQTKPYKPPKIEWVREIVEAADKAGIPVFLKNNLQPLMKEHRADYYYSKWGLRQEIPDGK